MNRKFIVNMSCDLTVAQVTQLLSDTGLRVEQSFDLRSAISLVPDCSCSHHGTDLCDCQYVVLLVHKKGSVPVTLVVHGHDEYSWVMMADNLKRHPSDLLRKTIAQVLAPMVFSDGTGAFS